MAENDRSAISITPSLVVSAGTLGKTVLQRVKALMRAEWGPDLPLTRFLAIDTDKSIADDLEGDEPLSPQELCILPGFDAAVLASNVDNRPEIGAWFPGRDRVPILSGYGTGQNRLAGRLSLFRNFDDADGERPLYPKLKDAVADLTHVRSLGERGEARSGRQWKIKEMYKGDMQVLLITSLPGGTGSGMFLDLYYLLYHLTKATHIRAFSVLPSMFEQLAPDLNEGRRSRLKANSFAALDEWERLCEVSSWDVQYGSGTRVTVEKPPFSRRYLFQIQSEEGYGVKEHADIIDAVANCVFFYAGAAEVATKVMSYGN